MEIRELPELFSFGARASTEEINSLEKMMGNPLPSDYKDMLIQADGYSLANGLVIYPLADVLERNETFEVSKYAPGYFAIGDDSGGRSILLSLENSGVYLVDQGSMDPDDMECLGSSLGKWITTGCQLK